MSRRHVLQISLTLEWLAAAYLGVLLRGLVTLGIYGAVRVGIGPAVEVGWITLIIPIIVQKHIEVWQKVPRVAQWAIAFLIGFAGVDLRPLFSN